MTITDIFNNHVGCIPSKKANVASDRHTDILKFAAIKLFEYYIAQLISLFSLQMQSKKYLKITI